MPDDDKPKFDDLELPNDDAPVDDDQPLDEADIELPSESSDVDFTATSAEPDASDETLDFEMPSDGDLPNDDLPDEPTDLQDDAVDETTDESVEEEKAGFLKKLSEASPYTVMLGISLAAIVIAILFLIMELGLYDFDVSAKLK